MIYAYSPDILEYSRFEAILKKTAIAYHPNPGKRAKLDGMQSQSFLKTFRHRE